MVQFHCAKLALYIETANIEEFNAGFSERNSSKVQGQETKIASPINYYETHNKDEMQLDCLQTN